MSLITNYYWKNLYVMILLHLLYHGYKMMYPTEHKVFFNGSFYDTKHLECGKKELQIALEWVTNNRLFLNMSKTKSIVFGTNLHLGLM